MSDLDISPSVDPTLTSLQPLVSLRARPEATPAHGEGIMRRPPAYIHILMAIAALVTLAVLLLGQISSGVAHVIHIDDAITDHSSQLQKLDARVTHVESGIAAIRGKLGIPER